MHCLRNFLMESEKTMEEYILNYYKKWLNEQKGSIVQQFSKLTKIANFLIISLIVALVALIVMFFLAVLKVIDEAWVFVPVLLEIIISVASYVYTCKHEIEHSEDKIDNYVRHCQELSDKLKEIKITNHTFIQEIIDRYQKLINEYDRTIERNQDRTDKVMQILIIPVSLEVLEVFLNISSNAQEALELGSTFIMVITIICLIAAGLFYMYNSLIKKRQNDYKQIVNDLQGVIDLDKFDPDDERVECAAKK